MSGDEKDVEPICPCRKKLEDTLMLECDQCETFWHITCCGLTGLTQRPINNLIANHWKCPRCFTFPEDVPKQDQPKLSNETVTSIISLVNTTVMKSIKTLLSPGDQTEDSDSDNDSSDSDSEKDDAEEATNVFEKVIRKRRAKQHHSIQKAIVEQREEETLIEKKKDNLIVFGMPESDAGDKKEEMLNDYNDLKKAYEERVAIETSDITHITRLGVKGDKPRPILITLAAQNKRRELLTKNMKLKLLKNNQSTEIYVSPDLTKKQREAGKILRDELKERKKTDKNLVIRNNKIVPFRPAAQATQTWASLFE